MADPSDPHAALSFLHFDDCDQCRQRLREHVATTGALLAEQVEAFLFVRSQEAGVVLRGGEPDQQDTAGRRREGDGNAFQGPPGWSVEVTDARGTLSIWVIPADYEGPAHIEVQLNDDRTFQSTVMDLHDGAVEEFLILAEASASSVSTIRVVPGHSPGTIGKESADVVGGASDFVRDVEAFLLLTTVIPASSYRGGATRPGASSDGDRIPAADDVFRFEGSEATVDVRRIDDPDESGLALTYSTRSDDRENLRLRLELKDDTSLLTDSERVFVDEPAEFFIETPAHPREIRRIVVQRDGHS